MSINEGRVERAERRLREAESNVTRQEEKMMMAEVRGNPTGVQTGRHVLRSFKDAVVALRMRLRDTRRRHG